MAVYTQVKISVPPELAASFKSACLSSGVSMAYAISRFMSETVADAKNAGAAPDLNSRGKRRRAVNKIISALQKVYDAEEDYRSNIPENLQPGPAFAASEETLEILSEAIDGLNSAF
jgi:hypothetical protein